MFVTFTKDSDIIIVMDADVELVKVSGPTPEEDPSEIILKDAVDPDVGTNIDALSISVDGVSLSLFVPDSILDAALVLNVLASCSDGVAVVVKGPETEPSGEAEVVFSDPDRDILVANDGTWDAHEAYFEKVAMDKDLFDPDAALVEDRAVPDEDKIESNMPVSGEIAGLNKLEADGAVDIVSFVTLGTDVLLS